MSILEYLLLFFTFSIIGYIYEVILHYFTKHKFIHSGILSGPYCFIYGLGIIFITIFSNSPMSAFNAGVVTCFILELTIGYILDYLHLPRWNYAHFPYNIKGLTCLYSLEVFGILSVVYYNLFKEPIVSLLILLPKGLEIYLLIIICIVISSDIAYTYFRKTK
ncbi:MAG: putative ABC transporter permease [Erysipelotrichales bacterium]|nr:putative ABC transporter permease [Erysipelotrichales bacterium]